MKTTQPIPFSELMSRATPGPFYATSSSIGKGDPEDYITLCHQSFEENEHSPYDMMLITRLLNFAHAGGVEALRDLLEHEGERNVCGIGIEFDSAALDDAKKRAERAIAILDGSPDDGTQQEGTQ